YGSASVETSNSTSLIAPMLDGSTTQIPTKVDASATKSQMEDIVPIPPISVHTGVLISLFPEVSTQSETETLTSPSKSEIWNDLKSLDPDIIMMDVSTIKIQQLPDTNSEEPATMIDYIG